MYFVRRSIMWSLLLGVFAAAWPRTLYAQTSGPWPPSLGAYFWQGVDGSGNGSTTDWEWDGPWIGGRWYAEGDEGCTSGCLPPVYYQLPPEDGDSLIFRPGFPDPNAVPYSISGGSHTLPNSDVLFAINATISGGSFDVDVIGIAAFYGESFPMTFNGTTLKANSIINASAAQDPLNFIGATLESPTIQLYGGGTGMSAINIHDGSQVKGGVAEIGLLYSSSGAALVHVDNSQMELLGVRIGFDDSEEDVYGELRLTGGSMASFAQFLLVGAEGSGRLELDGASQVDASEAYVNVGDQGEGDLHVTQSSILEARDLNVGLHANGNVAVDTGGRITSEHGKIGELAGFEGTVNLENGGEWETEDLVVGVHGTGYVYVRDGGELRISGDGVLGEHEGSRGVVNIIGSQAQLVLVPTATLVGEHQGSGGDDLIGNQTQIVLGPMGTLVVGDHGLGELYLTEAAEYTNGGKLIVGRHAHGHGIVGLYDASFMNVDDLILGEEHDAIGEMIVDSGSTLIINNMTVVGEHGEGELRVEGGGSATTGNTAVGEHAGSTGTATVTGTGSSWTVQSNLLAGVHGIGNVNVENGGTLVVTGPQIILGEEEDGHGALTISTAGNLSFSGGIIAGAFGSGVFALQAGAVYTASEVIVGEENTGIGDLNIELASHLQVTGELIVAAHGNANLNLRNGSILTTHETIVGEHLTSAALVFVETASTWNTQELIIGDSGIVNMSVLSGASIHAHEIIVAEHVGSFVEWAIDGEDSAVHADGLFLGGWNMHSGGGAEVVVSDQAHLFVEHELIVWQTAEISALSGGVTVGEDTTHAANGNVRVNSHGELGGLGTIEADVLNAAGQVAPGHLETTGILHVIGDYTQEANAALEIEIASASSYDALDVTGDMLLAGDLHVTLQNDFLPSVGQVFQILEWGTLLGEFAHLELPTLPTALVWDDSELYDTGALRIAPIVTGDYNGDGIVDAGDYTAWRDGLGGQHTPAGYGVWKQNFGRTSGTGAGTAVPEPNSSMWLATAWLGWLGMRRRLQDR